MVQTGDNFNVKCKRRPAHLQIMTVPQLTL